MEFLPFKTMWDRIEKDRKYSDVELFNGLMYLGEMMVKTIAAGLVAAISDDRDRHRYRQVHRLVRSDGMGDWSTAIEDILTGPSAQHLFIQAEECRAELIIPMSSFTWQFEAVARLANCV